MDFPFSLFHIIAYLCLFLRSAWAWTNSTVSNSNCATLQCNLRQCITHSSSLIKRYIMQSVPKRQPHLHVLSMALVHIVFCRVPCIVLLPAHTHYVTCWTISPEVPSSAGQRPVQNVNNCNQLLINVVYMVEDSFLLLL